MDHYCEVCFTSMFDHPERCFGWGDEEPHYHMTPLCCPGCPCGSFEEAHPE